MIEKQEVRHRRRRRTPGEIEQIVCEFESGDLTQVEFCRRQGLVLSTLGRYLKRLRSSSAVARDGLIAVELAEQKSDTEPCRLWTQRGGGEWAADPSRN